MTRFEMEYERSLGTVLLVTVVLGPALAILTASTP